MKMEPTLENARRRSQSRKTVDSWSGRARDHVRGWPLDRRATSKINCLKVMSCLMRMTKRMEEWMLWPKSFSVSFKLHNRSQVIAYLTLRRRKIRYSFGELSDANPQLVVIFLQIAFHRRWQTQLVNSVVRGVTYDRCTTQLLKWKHVVSVKRWRQHRLEKHHRSGIFVVLH